MKEVVSGSFDNRKTEYCAVFAVSHLSAFRPHYKQGETLGKGPEVWRNVSEHCLVAGVFADILADELQLESEDRDNVVRAALLHDWYKKHEALAQRQANKDGVLSMSVLDVIQENDEYALRQMGIPEEIIAIKAANVPDSPEGPVDDTEKILWYVDAMLSNTEPVSISVRFNDLERGWDGEKEDPERAERNKSFSDVYNEKYNGKSLYEVQRSIGVRLGREFSERIGFEGDPDQLPYYLRDKFVERVNSR